MPRSLQLSTFTKWRFVTCMFCHLRPQQVGERFRTRALKFPGLISGCTMDWFQRWPKEALIAVADHFLSKYDIRCSEEVKRQVIQSMGIFHDGVSESCLEYFQRFVQKHFFQRAVYTIRLWLRFNITSHSAILTMTLNPMQPISCE